ncbi:MAG: hypothetical protein DLM56_13265 [Pseudonocardiales bacterium]|nr:MAG: hypothetical protein DLM56_13265 [Pseudonocardiales bacterium]
MMFICNSMFSAPCSEFLPALRLLTARRIRINPWTFATVLIIGVIFPSVVLDRLMVIGQRAASRYADGRRDVIPVA